MSDRRAYRLTSLDAVRGLVIVVMALDHVRDYVMAGAEQDPASDPTVGAALFFTRWVTHFCAPVFVFLAGTSAGLMASRRTHAALGGFLLKRGLWLIGIEWFVIATAWSFAPWGIPEVQGLVWTPMGVIWAIGASMVVLAGAQFLGRGACLAIGAAILAGHNLLDPVWPAVSGPFDTSLPIWVALHAQSSIVVGPFLLRFVYPLLPWTGVMLAGYGAASLFEREPSSRRRALVRWGSGLTLAFIALRASHIYGDPNAWTVHDEGAVRTLIDFLNVTKYPPSLLFVLMTLGPSAILCAIVDRLWGPAREVLVTFGRVPFAFYVTHLYLIHTISLILGAAQGFAPSQFLTPMFSFPQGYGIGLAGVYLVWVLVVAALYPLCRWMAGVKARRTDWWLSYV